MSKYKQIAIDPKLHEELSKVLFYGETFKEFVEVAIRDKITDRKEKWEK